MKLFRKLIILFLIFTGATHLLYAEDKFTVAILQHNVFVDMYQLTYEHAIIAELEKYPYINAIIKDAAGNSNIQKQQVREMITRNVDAIILWPVDGSDIIEAVKEAHQANIPVIISNSNIHQDGYDFIKAYTGPDNVMEGKLAAEIMCDRLTELGVDGSAKIVEIKGLAGYTTAIERSEGFRERFRNICPQASIIDSEHGDWNRNDAYRVMTGFLSKHNDITAVFAADDNMGVGALNAVKKTGSRRNIVFVGATNFADGYLAMKRKEYWGSIYQSPVLDAAKAIETTVSVLKGEEVSFFNYFETPKITQDNMHNFIKPLF